MNKAKLVLAIGLAAGMNFGATKAATHSSAGAPVHRSDGCGAGWQWTKKKTLWATTSRQSTGGGGTFAMSSGTMGCQKHEFAENEKTAVDFALANLDSLSVEMAEGQGEFVAGLAESMGCPTAVFSQAAQSNYSTIFNADSAVGVYKNIKNVIRQDATLSVSCTIG